MGGTQRLAAVAAVSHARHHYNHTTPDPTQPTESTPININIVFASVTLCGVLVMLCAACRQRWAAPYKPEDDCRGVYTVSADSRLNQHQMEVPGPPPAYESVVSTHHSKDCHGLQEVVTEPRSPCQAACLPARDSELPSYEAAVLLKDTKL